MPSVSGHDRDLRRLPPPSPLLFHCEYEEKESLSIVLEMERSPGTREERVCARCEEVLIHSNADLRTNGITFHFY
jgi:hypothetical protein